MFCTHCGKEVEASFNVCPYCNQQIVKKVPKNQNKEKKSTNQEKVSLWCGVFSLMLFFTFAPSMVLGIIGLIFARKNINKEGKEDMSTHALVLSVLGMVSSISFIILVEIL